MPFLDHQLFVLGRSRLGLRDITQLHPLRFPLLDAVVKSNTASSKTAADIRAVRWRFKD